MCSILYDKHGNPKINLTADQNEKTMRNIAKSLTRYFNSTFNHEVVRHIIKEGADTYKIPYLWNAYLDSQESKNPLTTTVHFLGYMGNGVAEFFHDIFFGAPKKEQKIRDNNVVKDLDLRRNLFKQGDLLEAFEIADKYWDTPYYDMMVAPLKESFFKVNSYDGIPKVCLTDQLWIDLPQETKDEFRNNLPQGRQRFNFHAQPKLHALRTKLIIRLIEKNSPTHSNAQQEKPTNNKESNREQPPHPDELKNLNACLEDFDQNWLENFPFESIDLQNKKEEPKFYPLKNIPQTLNHFDLAQKPLFNKPQDLFTNNLLKSLEEFQGHNLNADEKALVKNMSQSAAQLNEEGDSYFSNELFSAMCACGQFVMGVAGQVISKKAFECAVNWSIRMVPAAASSAIKAHPYIATAACVGYVCYSIYSNLCSIPEDINKIAVAWSKGEYEKLGSATAQLGFDTTNTVLTITNVAKIFKQYNASKAFNKGVKKGVAAAQKEQQIIYDSQELITTVKNSKAYESLLKDAEKSGLSSQLFNKWLEGCCRALNNDEQVNELLYEMLECQKLQGIVTPKGLNKPITYDLAHIFNFISNNGKLSGGHSDYKGRIQNAGKILHQGLEDGPDGIYRAILSDGNGPGKESSFFPKDMSGPNIIRMLNELLSKEDFTKKTLNISGKYEENLSPNNIWDIKIYITKNSKAMSFYPIYENWQESLAKKIFNHENK